MPRGWAVNPACHDVPAPKGAVLQPRAEHPEHRQPAHIQPGRAAGSTALCHGAQAHGATASRPMDHGKEKRKKKKQRAPFLGSPRSGRSGVKLHSHRDSDSMLLDTRDSTRKHLPSQPGDLPMNQLRFIFKHPGGNGKQGTCRQPPAAPQHTHTGLLHPEFASRAIPRGVTTQIKFTHSEQLPEKPHTPSGCASLRESYKISVFS